MTGKKNSGSGIPAFYEKKEYQKIIDYIKNETEEFIKFNVWLYKEMPKLREVWRGEFGVGNGKA
jgi:hypothetical protein